MSLFGWCSFTFIHAVRFGLGILLILLSDPVTVVIYMYFLNAKLLFGVTRFAMY